MRIEQVSGDGYCFLESVKKALEETLGAVYERKAMAKAIMDEIANNFAYYVQFHTGKIDKMLTHVKKYFKHGRYAQNVVDLIVPATSNALQTNVHIIQNVGGITRLVSQWCTREPSQRNIFITYSSEHYGAVVPMEGDNLFKIPSPPPSKSSPQVTPGLTFKTPLRVDDVEEDTRNVPSTSKRNASQQEIMDASQLPDPYKPKNTFYERVRLTSSVFAQVQPEEVVTVPHAIDGNHIYVIDCEEEEVQKRVKDGRWFRMNTSAMKGLDGLRKVGRCMGSYQCINNECGKLLTEGVPNTSDYIAKSGTHVCRVCGYYMERVHCGCMKVYEYDRRKEMLTVWHEGRHVCCLKEDFDTMRNYAERELLSRDLISTPREMREHLIGYFLSSGQSQKAVEAARMTGNERLLEKLRYQNKGAQSTLEDSFKNLRNLKRTADEVDQFHLFKMNCRDWDEDMPNYVFKSSRISAQFALLMDMALVPKDGKHSLLEFEPVYFDGMHSRTTGFVTLTMWVYHPSMRKVWRLACMEAESENTANIVLFFNTWNGICCLQLPSTEKATSSIQFFLFVMRHQPITMH